MRLIAGSRLGPFAILGALGAGGMGEVYRAHDTRLGRDVALKILPDAFAGDPDRLARFQREAKLLASLNHPNIGGIHGLEDADGVTCLVLELVEGPTLAEKIDARRADGRGLPLDEALAVATQIAEALEAAHERGIVHRDLKPANVAFAADGRVKVLDFGLAKGSAVTAGTAIDLADSPTISSPMMTGVGTLLGTAAYMSPEQARGKTVDKRADVWAFGCVLYEMLTAKKAFAGETVSDVSARILEREPDWAALPAGTPSSIRRLLRRCLEKSPANRIHDIGDARLDIADAIGAPEPPNPVAAPQRWKERAGWLALVVIVAAIAIASALVRPLSDASLVQFHILEPENVYVYDLAVSPDGRHVAMSTLKQDYELSIRDLASLDDHSLPESKGGSHAFWSPDSTSIGFFADGKLKKIGLRSNSAVTVCALPAPMNLLSGGTWNAAGEMVFANGGALYRVDANGGQPSKLDLRDQPQRLQAGTPSFLPDGRHFLYRVLGSAPVDAIYVGSLDGGASTLVTEAQSHAIYVPPGYLLFVHGDALLAQPFNLTSLRLSGDPVAVGQHAAAGFLNGAPVFSVSATGVLAFETVKGGRSGQLTWFDRTREERGTIAAFQGSEYMNPSLSPDGSHLAANRMDPQTGNWDIWNIDLQSGIASRLTADPAQDSDAVWSPDGKEIVFASNRGGRFGLYRRSVTSEGPDELLTTSPDQIFPTDWSADGRFVLYHSGSSLESDVNVLPLSGNRTPQPTLHGAHTQFMGGRLAPSGKWIAYESNETGQYEVYIQSFMTAGRKVRVSRDSGVHPRWRGDGRELYFWNLFDSGIYAVAIDYGSDGVAVGKPVLISPPGVKVLSEGDVRTHYDITKDGKRLLIRTSAVPARPPVVVMMNWTKALGK